MEKNMQKNLSRYTHIYIKLNFARHQKPIQHCKSTLTSILKRRKKKNRSILSVCVLSRFSHFWLFVTPWTVACQAPLSMGFSRQESGVGCPALLQEIFSTQGSNPRLLHLLYWQTLNRLGNRTLSLLLLFSCQVVSFLTCLQIILRIRVEMWSSWKLTDGRICLEPSKQLSTFLFLCMTSFSNLAGILQKQGIWWYVCACAAIEHMLHSYDLCLHQVFPCCFSVAQLCLNPRPHGLKHARLPCPSLSPGVCSKFMPIKSVMPSKYLIPCCPLLLLPSIFPSIRVFSNESAVRVRWPKYWSFSFSISPSNE